MSESEPSRLQLHSSLGGSLPPLSLPPLSLPPRSDHLGISPMEMGSYPSPGLSHGMISSPMHNSMSSPSPSTHGVNSPMVPMGMGMNSAPSPLSQGYGNVNGSQIRQNHAVPTKRRMEIPQNQYPQQFRQPLEQQRIEAQMRQIKSVPGSPNQFSNPPTPSSLPGMRYGSLDAVSSPSSSMGQSPASQCLRSPPSPNVTLNGAMMQQTHLAQNPFSNVPQMYPSGPPPSSHSSLAQQLQARPSQPLQMPPPNFQQDGRDQSNPHNGGYHSPAIQQTGQNIGTFVAPQRIPVKTNEMIGQQIQPGGQMSSQAIVQLLPLRSGVTQNHPVPRVTNVSQQVSMLPMNSAETIDLNMGDLLQVSQPSSSMATIQHHPLPPHSQNQQQQMIHAPNARQSPHSFNQQPSPQIQTSSAGTFARPGLPPLSMPQQPSQLQQQQHIPQSPQMIPHQMQMQPHMQQVPSGQQLGPGQHVIQQRMAQPPVNAPIVAMQGVPPGPPPGLPPVSQQQVKNVLMQRLAAQAPNGPPPQQQMHPQMLPPHMQQPGQQMPVRAVIPPGHNVILRPAHGLPPGMQGPPQLGMPMPIIPRHSGNYQLSQIIDEKLIKPTQNVPSAKERYREYKRKFKNLVFENECYQEELRNLQRKLLKLSRDKNFLLDRLGSFEKLSDSSDEDEEANPTPQERPKSKKRSRPTVHRKRPLSPSGKAESNASGTPSPCPSPAPSNVLIQMLQPSTSHAADDNVKDEMNTPTFVQPLPPSTSNASPKNSTKLATRTPNIPTTSYNVNGYIPSKESQSSATGTMQFPAPSTSNASSEHTGSQPVQFTSVEDSNHLQPIPSSNHSGSG